MKSLCIQNSMKKSPKLILAAVAVAAAFNGISVAQARAIWGGYDELTPPQKDAIQRGQQVTFTEDVPGAPWPKITIYQRVEATPEEGLAVFSDYELQPSYIPSMQSAKIVAQIDRVTTRVEYLMDIAGDVRYTADDRVSSYDDRASYRLDWKMLRGDSMREMWGHARFEPLGTGTLVIYHTFIVPTSGLAGWFRKKAISMAQQGAHTLVQQIQKERKDNPALLQRQLETLRAALDQSPASSWED